ncbi:MAG: P-type conjugative transfer protein TrbJ [Paracoccaceae bacterium]|nr:P-type conjugative transfer protein TrbJ [Paracoccaceae bacterium]
MTDTGKTVLRGVTLLLATSVGAAMPAGATPNPAGFATEFTQMANNTELVSVAGSTARQVALQAQQLTQQINLVAGQLKAYQNMVLNTLNLPKTVWGDVTHSLDSLRNVIQTANTLAAKGAQLDTLLKSNLVSDPLYQASPLSSANYAQRYDQWAKDSQNALTGVLSANKATMQDVGTESALIKTIQAQGQSVEGQVQAIQVGNELAASTARQLAALRALTAAQNEQTSVFQARWLAKQDAAQVQDEQIQNTAPPDFGHWDLKQALKH